ncbi:MAG: tetratricopeptide repeat protein [Candidatus Bipolaricaulota bacterium]|nr:tetratricopeptide repeat protein [Candidatus Bipolaricaulota bacterium]MDW8031210.1 tetratricopeptide repeat protein [Candidatus Bipolaricaulota bacterium]
MTLPTGTVTFLFTDIEGSSKLWEQDPEVMSRALAEHNALLRRVIEAHRGYIFKLWGDAVYAAFDTAIEALNAAIEAQQELMRRPWETPEPLRVRMALHTGVAEIRDGDYFGPTLNRCARLLSAAHGGQILLSAATEELVRDALPKDVSLRSLGYHRLKDLQRPEQIYQVIHPQLPAEFSSLRTLNAVPNNLPIQLTSFIGREREMREVKELLKQTRLLTLTGSGGCGKTRLALQVAADLLEEYPDGIWFVDLSVLADPALVPSTVAATLGIHEEPGRPALTTLAEALKPRTLLLILDNCEHLVTACAQLAETLLRTCPTLKILATSREALGIAGEVAWRVPSLSLPQPHELTHPDSLARITRYEAIRLFIERAEAASPEFRVTPQNIRAIAQICQRLDGIPLAIELAAARVKALSVEQIAARLDDRFRLLTGGSRTALPRQQTLRAMMDWSYELLNERERTLFRRLSTFAGGFTLEAAEAICADEQIPVHEIMDLLLNLVSKSLVVFSDEDARYRLLETVRQYARDKLLETGEAVQVRTRHRDWFLALAERAESALQGPDQALWLKRLELEHDNLRAALEWSSTDPETGLRLASALWLFWYLRGYVSEGREWLKQFLEKAPEAPSSLRAKALYGASMLARAQDDYALATKLLEESLALYRAAKDNRGVALALGNLGIIAFARGDYARATKLHEESLEHFRQLHDKIGIASALSELGNVALYQNDLERAERLLEESLALSRAAQDDQGIALALRRLGAVLFQKGERARAKALLQESLELYRGLGAVPGLASVFNSLGMVALQEGDLQRAGTLLRQSLAHYRDVGDKWHIALCLDRLAQVAAAQGDWKRAVRLMGAEEALREAIGAPLPPSEHAGHEQTLTKAHEHLDEESFAAAWADGYAMKFEEAIAYALSEEPSAL